MRRYEDLRIIKPINNATTTTDGTVSVPPSPIESAQNVKNLIEQQSREAARQ